MRPCIRPGRHSIVPPERHLPRDGIPYITDLDMTRLRLPATSASPAAHRERAPGKLNSSVPATLLRSLLVMCLGICDILHKLGVDGRWDLLTHLACKLPHKLEPTCRDGLPQAPQPAVSTTTTSFTVPSAGVPFWETARIAAQMPGLHPQKPGIAAALSTPHTRPVAAISVPASDWPTS